MKQKGTNFPSIILRKNYAFAICGFPALRKNFANTA